MPSITITDMRTGKAVSQSDLLDRLARADVVFLGEQHTDPATHALELSVLKGLHKRAGARLTLGMEMWERDAQPALDSYLQGRTAEAAFLKTARPWSNYRTDYRPLVEYAKANGIPVLAANVPQAVASAVGKRGLAALADAPPGLAARLVQAPQDGAWQRFKAVMESMGGAHGGAAMGEATVGHFYEAQCVRDETMAETITRRLGRAQWAGAAHQRPVPFGLRRRHPPPRPVAQAACASHHRLDRPGGRREEGPASSRQRTCRLRRVRPSAGGWGLGCFAGPPVSEV